MSFAKLDELGKRLEAIEHAQSMLGVDEAVMMPIGGGEKRAEAMSVLAGMYHEMATAPEIADWIGAAADEPLDEMQQAALREFRRIYTNMTCLSSDFVRQQVDGPHPLRAALARAAADRRLDRRSCRPSRASWTRRAKRRRCAPRRSASTPYDAMMEQYDPGNRAADIAPVFAELKTFLKDFVPAGAGAPGGEAGARVR